MKLVYPEIELPIIDGKYVSVCCIEKPSLFANVQQDIVLQIRGEDGPFVLSENNAEIELMSKAQFVPNPFLVSANDRRVTNALNKRLSQSALESGIDELIKHKMLEVFDLVNQIILTERIELTTTFDFLTTDILKLFNVEVELGGMSDVVGLIEDFMLLQRDFLGVELFFFNQITGLLEASQMNEIVSFCSREEIYICLLESHVKDTFSSKDIRIIIIDEDLCELLR